MANEYESFEVDYNNPHAAQARSRGQSHGSIQRFLHGNRNPDGTSDYGRLGSAFDFDKPAQNQTPAQQWNSAPSSGGQGDLYGLLMERAKQGTNVDRMDPTVRAQVDPVAAQFERSSRNYIDDLAERAGPHANLQGERRLASERSGQAAGALEAEVIGREVAARRGERGDALGLWSSVQQGDKRMALDKELTDASRNQQMDQFMRELALREWDLGNSWDYRWQTGF